MSKLCGSQVIFFLGFKFSFVLMSECYGEVKVKDWKRSRSNFSLVPDAHKATFSLSGNPKSQAPICTIPLPWLLEMRLLESNIIWRLGIPKNSAGFVKVE